MKCKKCGVYINEDYIQEFLKNTEEKDFVNCSHCEEELEITNK